MVKFALKVLALFALAFALGYATPSAKADGSDPMPICRGKRCFLIEPVSVAPKVTKDGGPLPLCPPWKRCCSLVPTCNAPKHAKL